MKKKKKRVALKAKKQVRVRKGYSFFEDVYDVVRLIPKGRVTSYGAIARYLGAGKSARMVGYAMNSSGTEVPPVPAHRVLNRTGMLTGRRYFGPKDEMKKLLEDEGVKIRADMAVDFDKLFWDPFEELII